ncbi:thermonuclease family protein [Natrialbaceae archaeon A-CW2]
MGTNPSENEGVYGRRTFLTVTGTAAGAALTGVGAVTSEDDESGTTTSTAETGLETLSFYSSASQIAADGESELVDEETVVVWAEPTAENFETTDDGPTTVVYEDEAIPLVSQDGSVVGIGSVDFLSDDQGGFDADNEKFALNLFEELMDEGVVLWDEGHDQFGGLALENYHSFRQYAADSGYDLEATTNLLGTASLLFPSTASQVAPDGGPLTDSSHVAVWAEPSAQNVDDDGDEASHIYENVEIPLVSRDGDVVGFGTPELIEDGDMTEANERFVLNVLEDTVGNSGTVVWDDAHGSFYDSSTFGEFADAIEAEGYEFEASEDLLAGGENVDTLEFFSTASLLDADEQPLTDDSLVAVWAEPTAENVDEAGDGYVSYDQADADIPLVAVDGNVVGFGAELGPDASDVDANRELIVDIWADRIGANGTVLYDESHDQELSLSDYSQLQSLAADRGFSLEATDDLEADLSEADGVMLTTFATAFTADERATLTDFVDDGGSVFIHDQADFGGHETANLNAVTETLEVSFRFNSDQVLDEENSGWAPFVVQTTNVNEAFDFFGGSESDEVGIAAADAVAIASPADAYTDAELEALESHVVDGGALFLFDESEFVNEETANLNEIAETLEVAFRFNADQVEDDANNVSGQPFLPTTTNFNGGFDLFEGLESPGLEDAQGLVVTSPTESFSGAELDALESFRDDGGAIFLFDQSDFGGQGNDSFGFDETENLNAIADALALSFRFNSDQVNDLGDFDIETGNFNTDYDYFADREKAIGVEFERDEAYYGRVVRVFDGDTFEVEFDTEFDYRDVIRNVGMDTAETAPATNDPEEWFGIEDLDHLDTWGSNATNFALDVMAPDAQAGESDVEGRRVKVTFDEAEPLRGNYGRLLSYMYYDPEDYDATPDTGDFSVNYNLEAVEKGYARVYSSGFAKHDTFAAAEEAALADGRRVWSAADFDALEEIRNDPFEEVFVPRASSVTTASGPLADDRAPLYAGETAHQEALDDGGAFDEYEDAPLVGVDQDNAVAVVGGIMVNEAYEEGAGFEADTSEYGNYAFFANLARYLSDNDGHFLLEGGHGQFGAEGSVSLERVEFFLRFVEGVGNRLRQINDVVHTLPEADDPTVVFLTAPERAYTEAELAALREYRDAGGAVILVGSAAATADTRAKLNDVAAGLGSDLRLNDDRIVDGDANLVDDPELPVTGRFDESFPLFDPFGENPMLVPEVQAYLERIANEDGLIDRAALDGAIEDWSENRIDSRTLEAVVEAHEGQAVVAEV